MKKKLVLTAIVTILLAAGMSYAQEGPPQIINVDGGVYYMDGSPAEGCTPVVVELYSAEGALKTREELCTGQYFPPVEQFGHRYKLALAGTQNEDRIVVRALGISNESVAKDFTLIDITGPRPGLIEDLAKGVSYITRLIIPEEHEEGTPVQPPSEEEEGLPPPTPSETKGISALVIIIALVIVLFVFLKRQKKKKKSSKGTASGGLLLIGLLAMSFIISGIPVEKYIDLTALTVLPGGEGVAEEGGPAVTEEPAGKPEIIIEGGFPTGSAVKEGEGDVGLQQVPAVNVNNVSHGAVFGPGGEDIMNTTWSDYTFVSASGCGEVCDTSYGNCTYLNVSLIKKSDGSLIDNKSLCSMEGYPGVAQYYNQFKTVLTGEDGASKTDYNITAYAQNGSLEGKTFYNVTQSLSVYIVDVNITQPMAGIPPTWGNNQSSTPASYDPTNVSNFTALWADNNVMDTVIFESNFSGTPQNYTMSNFTPTGYYNFTDVLPAGTFYWKTYGNDTENNWNVSDTWYVTIAQSNENVVNLWLNGNLNQNLTITYPTQSNATATAIAGPALFRNTTNLGGAVEVTVLGGGFYAYKANATGNQNYSANSTGVTYYLQVNTADNPVDLYLNGQLNQNISVTYGASINSTGAGPDGISLYRNESSISNGQDIVPGAGLYEYKVNSTGDQNYSANTTGQILYALVNQSTPSVSVVFTPSSSETYGTTTTATCSITTGDSGATLILFRNGTQVNTSTGSTFEKNVLGAGVYNYTCVYSASENYTTGASLDNYLAISQADPAGNMFLAINGTQGDVSITYPEASNVTGWSVLPSDQDLTFNLYRNDSGAAIASGNPAGDIEQLGGGAYLYVYNTTGGTNYTAGSSTARVLTVDKTSNVVHLYLNDQLDQNLTIAFGTASNATATSQAGTVYLYRDEVQKASGASPQSEVDVLVANPSGYAYKVNATGDQNYSDNTSIVFYLTITKAPTSIDLYLNGALNSNNTITYPAEANATAVCNQTGSNTTLYRDGNLVNFTSGSASEVIRLGNTTYNYTAACEESQNYSSSTNTQFLSVLKGTPVDLLGISPSTTVTYPATTTTTCSAVSYNNEVTASLFRNSSGASSPETIELGAGTYEYSCNNTETQNYTASSNTSVLTVQQNTTNPVDLYINNGTLYANQNVSITYGTAITANGTAVYSDSGTVNLYRDGQGTTNPETSIVLSGGEHVYKTNNTGNDNYTANATGATYYVIVNKVTPSVLVTLTPSSSETYGTTTTATCSITTGDSGATLILFRNGTQVNSSAGDVIESNVLGAGVYNYTCVYSASENYTDGANLDNYLTITQSDSSSFLRSAVNGTEANATITYSEWTNLTAWSILADNQDLTLNLYRNGALVDSGNTTTDVNQLGAGTYVYIYNTTGGVNYTSGYIIRVVTVNPANATITLLLNGTDNDYEFMNNTNANFTAFTSISGLTIDLYTNFSDGTNKLWDSGTTPFVNITNMTDFGTWNFTARFAGNQNYTANSSTHYATVSELRPFGPGNLTILLNKTTEEAILNWTFSNSTNVFNYIIYVTDDYDAGFNYSNPYTTVSNTTTLWTDTDSDGVDERYYVVRANNSYGQTDINNYTVGKYNLKLYTDWNLISLPLIVFNDTMDDIFYTADNGDIVERWDGNAQSYDRTDFFAGFGWSGDFTTMDLDRGYWYYSKKAGYLTTPFNVTIVGEVPIAARSQTIYNKTWSMIGWTSIHTKDLDNAFTNSANGDLIELFSAVPDIFERTDYFGGFGWYGDFANIEPGRGYWYYSQNTTLYSWTYQP